VKRLKNCTKCLNMLTFCIHFQFFSNFMQMIWNFNKSYITKLFTTSNLYNKKTMNVYNGRMYKSSYAYRFGVSSFNLIFLLCFINPSLISPWKENQSTTSTSIQIFLSLSSSSYFHYFLEFFICWEQHSFQRKSSLPCFFLLWNYHPYSHGLDNVLNQGVKNIGVNNPMINGLVFGSHQVKFNTF
jgi:hypothetical protein